MIEVERCVCTVRMIAIVAFLMAWKALPVPVPSHEIASDTSGQLVLSASPTVGCSNWIAAPTVSSSTSGSTYYTITGPPSSTAQTFTFAPGGGAGGTFTGSSTSDR